MKIVGDSHKLVLRADGSFVGWGQFQVGQLGPVAGITATGATTGGLVTIALPAKAIDIAAGIRTSCALLEDGTVVAWGDGRIGQLGSGSNVVMPLLSSSTSSVEYQGRERPAPVAGLRDVVGITAAGMTALALLEDGTVHAWGPRASGVIGDGTVAQTYGDRAPDALAPVQVPHVANIVSVSTSNGHVLALTRDGRVLAWGSNFYGELGRAPRQETRARHGRRGSRARGRRGGRRRAWRVDGIEEGRHSVGLGIELEQPVRLRRANRYAGAGSWLRSCSADGARRDQRHGHRRGLGGATHAGAPEGRHDPGVGSTQVPSV